MLSKWRWRLRRFGRRLWVRASLFSLIAVATSLASIYLAPLVPDDLSDIVGSDAVDSILTILASSMLTVTTFSLTVMVTAYGAATSNATPRATKLLVEDATTQNALGTFLGSFLFSLVGIIALSTGLYGQKGRVILFGATVLVIAFIIVTFLRWIDYLSKLGRVGETIDRVEAAVTEALSQRMQNPNLGGRPLPPDLDGAQTRGRAIRSTGIGYVQHIDVPSLSECAGETGEVHVVVLPGRFVGPSDVLGWLVGCDEAAAEKARECFTVSDERSFDQDPRFGLVVLSEIASRALSPAVNDPGTAIDVLGRAVRVLALWADGEDADDDGVPYPSVRVGTLDIDDLFDDVFTPIARDGAGNVGVQLRLMKALRTLATMDHPEVRQAARHQARMALKRAEQAMALPEDLARVRAVAEPLLAAAEDGAGPPC